MAANKGFLYHTAMAWVQLGDGLSSSPSATSQFWLSHMKAAFLKLEELSNWQGSRFNALPSDTTAQSRTM